MTEDRRLMTDDRRQRTEDRRQRTEDRGQKTEDRWQRDRLMSERIESFRDLNVYKLAIELQQEIFELTKRFPKEEAHKGCANDATVPELLRPDTG